MSPQWGIRSLAISFLFSTTIAFDLDINSPDSVKSVSKTLASAIVSTYKEFFNEERIPGLFDEPYYWWEAGAVWNGLIEYSFLTGDAQFNDIISSALLWQVGDFDAFMPANQTKTLGNDDQSTWALAALTAAETGFPENGTTKWVELAANVFNTQVLRWDNLTCGGGLRWQIFTFNNGYNYKNSVSAGNFFLLSARLAQMTGNATYSEWATKTFEWAQEVGFISDDFHVFDGADAQRECASINHIQWTNTHAIFTEGSAVLYNLTKGEEKWKNIVTNMANTTSVFLNNSTSVLTEVACEARNTCNIDQRALKGIAIRSYARAAQAAPIVSDSLKKIVQASAPAAAKACTGDETDVKCSLSWVGGSNRTVSVKDEGLGEAFNALEAVQAVLRSEAKPLATTNSTSGNGNQQGSPTTGGGATTPTGSAHALGVSWRFVGVALVLVTFCL